MVTEQRVTGMKRDPRELAPTETSEYVHKVLEAPKRCARA